VRLIAPQFVKPYVRGNKNDANDAEAICEAVGRPDMRFVRIKTVAQQDIQALHRVRSERVTSRTALVNQIRRVLAEYGVSLAHRVMKVRQALPVLIENADERLSEPFVQILSEQYDDLVALDERIARLDAQIERIAREDGAARRLMSLRRVGPI